MTRSGLTWQNLFAFMILALVIVTLLARCKPALPVEPTYTVVDIDAAALLDAGPDADVCGLACASFAASGCHEANGACLHACEMAHETQLISDLALNCVARSADRESVRACGDFCR